MLGMVIGLDSSSNIPRSVQSDSATTCLLYEFASLLAAAASRLPESDALLSYCSIVTMYIVSTSEFLRRSQQQFLSGDLATRPGNNSRRRKRRPTKRKKELASHSRVSVTLDCHLPWHFRSSSSFFMTSLRRHLIMITIEKIK